jgi:ubiquinone/menaquinone biosynthesis C-methylase UbiE
MTVLDFGCGMGFSAIALAGMVGEKGRVIAVDVQQEMLEVLRRRAERAGVAERIRTHCCQPDAIGVDDQVGFALAFWSVHEVPDRDSFLGEVRSLLIEGGAFLVIEPNGRVPPADFRAMLDRAGALGFQLCEEPRVLFSRAAVLRRR